MLNKHRTDGVITIHQSLPPHLLHHTSPRNAKKKSSSSSSSSEEEEECPYDTTVMQESSRIVTHSGSQADKAHTVCPCSVKHLQDQFLSERREADAVTRPLLDTENGFIKDVADYLEHRDLLSVKKRELLHKRWTECVWWPVQCSIKRRFGRGRCEGAEPTKWTHVGYEKYRSTSKVSTSPLKDPLFLYSHSRLEEMRLILHCQTGRVDAYQVMEQSRNEGDLQRGSRSPGPVYIAVDDGRCFRPECWSAIGLSRSYPVKS